MSLDELCTVTVTYPAHVHSAVVLAIQGCDDAALLAIKVLQRIHPRLPDDQQRWKL